MSIVTIQVGQCGNQVGGALFAKLAEEADAGPDDFRRATQEAFFRPRVRSDGAAAATCTARAVLVDMEPKARALCSPAVWRDATAERYAQVVANTLRAPVEQRASWAYNERGTLTFQSGSGNNWARGYNTYGPQCRGRVCELVRREAEACDHLSGFLFLQSMAGGTGAGLGTYVVEAMRDEYPSACLLSHCVWPYESGEVIVQNYNTMLTLASLLDAADAVVVVQNEMLHAAAHKQMNIDRPTFEDLNSLASRSLASAILPASWRPAMGESAASRPAGALLSDAVCRLCSQPSLRLLSLLSVPQMPARSVDFTTFTWPALLKRLRQMLLAGSALEDGLDWSVSAGGGRAQGCAAAVLTLRGKGSGSADVSSLTERRLYAPWAPQPLSVAWQPARFARCDMAATLLANSACAAVPAQRMLHRAYAMYSSRAYCHQYAAHGLEEAHFDAAFARVEDAVACYGSLR